MRKILNYYFGAIVWEIAVKNALSRPKIKNPSHQGRHWSACFWSAETGLQLRILRGKRQVSPPNCSLWRSCTAVEETEEGDVAFIVLLLSSLLVSFGTSGWRIRALLSSVCKSSSRVQKMINKVLSWQVYLPGDELLVQYFSLKDWKIDCRGFSPWISN